MFKRILTLLICVVCLFSSITPLHALENSVDLGLTCKYAISIDAKSGLVLYNKNMDKRMYPASMTKVMTVILALDLMGNDLDKKTVITQSDIDTIWETGASAANFEVGENVTYRDLLYGAILPSGADACRALANNLCGSQEEFVKRMNELAKKLKLKDTHFVNTTGIHNPNHYTTVHDMALIVQYAVKNKDFKEIYAKRYQTSSNGLHQWVNKAIYNARRAKIDTTNILGSKSGYTDVAKNCLSSLDLVNGNEIITIVGHSDNNVRNSAAVQDTLDIMNYVSKHYSVKKILTKGTKVTSLDVAVAKDNQKIKIKNLNDTTAFLPNDFNKKDLKYKYSYKKLEAPVKKGAKVGKLKVYYKNNLVYQEEYVATKEIERDKFQDVLNEIMNFIFPYGLAIVLVLIYFIIDKKKKRR